VIAPVQNHLEPADERGATVMVVAMLMVAMMICAAFAVDFGSWYSRAEELQNAADAAALAGAMSYSLDGDETAAVDQASEMLRQNGIDPGDADIDIAVTFPSSTEVAVEVLDTDVALFFSRIVRTDAMNIRRDAVAKQNRCAEVCAQSIPIPRPVSSINVPGSGDGFTPILIDQRMFAINHHIVGDIVCIDLVTQQMCPGYPRLVQPNTAVLTENVVHTAVVGPKIFFSGQDHRAVLACFDTSTGAPCANSPVLVANLPPSPPYHEGIRGRASGPVLVNDRIYLFSDDNRVHCHLPTDMSRCANYPMSDGLAAAGLPVRTGDGDTASMTDRIVDDSGKIYVATHYRASPHAGNNGGPYADYGVQLHCWDTVQAQPCEGFSTTRLFIFSNGWNSGRLFFNRDTSGTITGVCASRSGTHECVDLSGSPAAKIAGLEDSIDTEVAVGFLGTHTYHEPTNRQLLNGGLSTSTTYCWDFTTSRSCGRIVGNNTADYGYAYRGNCIYSLGDTSIFWTFDISMTPGCREGTASATIRPCLCSNGERQWGAVRFSGDRDLLTAAGPFETFDVSIFDPADRSNVLLSDSLLGSNGDLDLSSIPPTLDAVVVEVSVRAKGNADPWATGQVPEVEVGWTDKPHLVD